MRIGSLFSGIGGLELGLERAGLGETMWQAESDPLCRRILARHWPGATRFVDVRDVHPFPDGEVDLICGGFPCQDVSVAGRGAGIDGDRSGLWYEFARVVDEFQPAIVVAENVSRGRSRWLPQVLGDLAHLGYVPAAVTVPAAAVGAPHERARTFVVADTDGELLRILKQREPARPPHDLRDEGQGVAVDDGQDGDAPRPSAWASLPDLRGVADGLPAGLDGAADWSGRLRVLGNAVVPQVAHALGRLIAESVGRAK